MESKNSEKNVDNQWSYRISNIRALAIVLVVLGHSIILYSSSWNLYSTPYQVPVLDYIKKIIDYIQMPLFFSLSGFLFLHSYKKYDSFYHFTKVKFLRLIVPYFFVYVFFLVPIRRMVGYESYATASLNKLFEKFVQVSDVGHLWFLPTLFIIFAFAFLFFDILGRLVYRISIQSATWILFLISILLYYKGYMISFGYGPLQSAYVYLIWFISGMLLNIYDKQLSIINSNKHLKVIIFICLLILIALSFYYPATTVMIQFMFLVYIYIIVPNSKNDFLYRISKDSFGIYLFHSPLIYFVFSNFSQINPFYVIFLNFVICGLISILITETIRKTPLRMIIGV